MLWWTLRQLKSKDPDTRYEAAEKLGKSHSPRALRPLVAALLDHNGGVRRAAARALPKIDRKWQSSKPAQALLPVLLTKSGDTKQSLQLRSAAVVALCRIDRSWNKSAPAAALFPALLVGLRDSNPEVREAAIEALGWIGDTRAVGPLVAALKDQDADVRRAAAVALGQIRDTRAIQPLVAALADAAVGPWVLDALPEIDPNWPASEAARAEVPTLVTALRHPNRFPQVREVAAEVLGRIGDVRAVAPLFQVLKDDSFPTAVAQKALDRILPKGMHSAGAAVLANLLTDLHTSDGRIREAAEVALGQTGDPQAAEPLVAVLKDDAWGPVRAAAAEALGKIRDVTASHALVAALKDRNHDVRMAAARTLTAMDWRPVDDSERALRAVVRGQWEKATSFGQEAIGAFVAALGFEQIELARKALVALQALGWQPADEKERELYERASGAVRPASKRGPSRDEASTEPAAVIVFDRQYPYGDEARVIDDLLREMRLTVPPGRIYSTVQPGILSRHRDMLPHMCREALTPMVGAAYDEASLQATPFEMADKTGGVVLYHPSKKLRTADTRYPVITEIDSALSAIRNALATGKRIPGEPIRSRGITIMKFSTGHESNYKHHIDLLAHLADKGFLGRYDLWRLDLSGADDLCGLIVVCGSSDDMTDYARKTYYLPAAEAFVAEKCGGDWNKITAASSISDTPDSGMGIELSGAEHDLAELRAIVLDRVSSLIRIESARATTYKQVAPADLEPMLAALNGVDAGARVAAENALDKFDPNWRDSEAAKRSVPALVAALEDLGLFTRIAAVSALKAMRWQPADDRERALFARVSEIESFMATRGLIKNE